MIRLAESLETLYPLCKDSPFGCQIISAAEGYGTQRDFARFWADEAAAYSLMDGVMRIAGEITNPEETRAFLGAVGTQRVVCSEENAAKLSLPVEEKGVILDKDLPEAAGETSAADDSLSVRTVYTVLHACQMVGEFEPFYLDLSHRVRHGTACICGVTPRGEEHAAAVSVAVLGRDAALLSAVGVLPEYRRKGLGTQAVKEMEARLSGRVFLLREADKNERFYAALGYRPRGFWCQCTME